MPYSIDIEEAKRLFPDYEFVAALTPSAQKCAFHVRDADGTDLCLKIISPEYEMAMLEREVLALQVVQHVGIARLVEFTISSKRGVLRRYVLEEFVDGRDLTEGLAEAPWELGRVVAIFSAICDALGALREKNVVHRDLKPSNIRLGVDGAPRIIDFGLARHLTLPDLTQTNQGARIGTPRYFAPEQFDGTKYDIDHRTDLWALGVLMYEASCGVHPFFTEGMSLDSLRNAVCEGQLLFARDAFNGLRSAHQLLIRKLLEKRRERRPGDARQVAKILRTLGGMA